MLKDAIECLDYGADGELPDSLDQYDASCEWSNKWAIQWGTCEQSLKPSLKTEHKTSTIATGLTPRVQKPAWWPIVEKFRRSPPWTKGLLEFSHISWWVLLLWICTLSTYLSKTWNSWGDENYKYCHELPTDLSSQHWKRPDSIILEMNRLTLPYHGVNLWKAKVFQLALKTKWRRYVCNAFAGPTGLCYQINKKIIILIKPGSLSIKTSLVPSGFAYLMLAEHSKADPQSTRTCPPS